jgi:hypothetical protein
VSIRKRGTRSYQVRVEPFRAKTFPTREAAQRYELELLLRRAQGDRFLDQGQTLGEEIDAWLARHRALSGARERTVEFYERSAKIWSSFMSTQVSALRRAPVEDFIATRARTHPRSARNELEFLKRVLRDARGRGQRVDEGVLSIPPVKARPRDGRALTVEQLYELASWFPESSRRLVILAGMVGARQVVWFRMTEDLLDLQACALTIPASLAKNNRAHRVYLTDIEVRLFREQLLARAAGTALIFPTLTGRQWTRIGFRERVSCGSVGGREQPRNREPAVSVRGLHLPPASAHRLLPNGACRHGSGRGVRAGWPHRRRRALSREVQASL